MQELFNQKYIKLSAPMGFASFLEISAASFALVLVHPSKFTLVG